MPISGDGGKTRDPLAAHEVADLAFDLGGHAYVGILLGETRRPNTEIGVIMLHDTSLCHPL